MEMVNETKQSKHTHHKSNQNSTELISSSFAIHDVAYIVGGKYCGKSGTVVKICPETVKVAIAGDKNNVKFIRMKFAKTALEKEAQTVNDFRLADDKCGGMRFGTRTVTKLFTEESPKLEESSFLSHMVGRRTVLVQTPINKVEANPVDRVTIDSSGNKFELVSRKVVTSDRGGLYLKAKDVQYMYMQTEGTGLTTVSPAEHLSQIADFSSLTTRKVVARLELFQSPAYKCKSSGDHLLRMLDQSCFGDIEEEGHVGCGFICEDLLVDILGNNAVAKRAICIQVRGFVPMKGVYKGMLLKKRMKHGPKILLPESMKKIPASKAEGRSEKGCLLVTQAGVDPSSTNLYMGRMPTIDQNAKAPPDSFCQKEFSKMILRLFRSLKVPDSIARKYAKESTRKAGHNKAPLPLISHSFLRGVADPTGKIPPNHVFLTGVRNDQLLGYSVFITRSPCIKASDGRMIKVITSRPAEMTVDEYDWLNMISFGAVIFGFSKKGMLSTPERIAHGDLDGDRYFVCWEKAILEHIEADPLVDIPVDLIQDKQKDADLEIRAPPSSLEGNWFTKAQEFMADPKLCEIDELVCKLYKASEKAADADEERFMRNPDAECFADAYYQALDNGKHGTKVILPEHLWDKLPKALHKHLIAA